MKRPCEPLGYGKGAAEKATFSTKWYLIIFVLLYYYFGEQYCNWLATHASLANTFASEVEPCRFINQ